ncbi:MAG: DegT/DnrJ/EryC1/StrS family aminotransferase [Candidatus Omnitrophica bacterium]|nr:DegT/DnrJ/EryC1/StrS family aminotransferase [Candidatus Omnitrophota bacterium]
MKVEFYKHNIGEEEKRKALEVLDGIFLTTGKYVEEFEKTFSDYLGVEFAVGVSSCTAALHLALMHYGIGAGDEVITTPLTFIATANAILYSGAKLVFVDVEKETGLIDPEKVEAAVTKRTKAIIPVHLYGVMADMKRLRKVADKYGLKIIEDSAHCIEGERDGIRPGESGDAACFSFYATKNITSGEGGAITVHTKEEKDRLYKLRSHGMSREAYGRYESLYRHWDMETLGWKYNMNNIQAALLLNQIKNVEKYWKRREEICRRYESAFKDEKKIRLLTIPPHTKSARHLITILVDPQTRDEILAKLQKRDIGVAVNFRPIHLLTYYRQTYGYKIGAFPASEEIGGGTISLPLYPQLTDEEIEYVIKSVKEAIRK